MKLLKNTIGKNPIFQAVSDKQSKMFSSDGILNSWDNALNFIEEDKQQNTPGFRTPQLGALFAIKAHWTVSRLPATIVMPTGTGKTETMIATIISEKCKKTLIIVPSNLLRIQTLNKCTSLGILKEVGVVSNKVVNPVVGLLVTTPSDLNELKTLINKSNIIITTMSLLNRFSDVFVSTLHNMCSELFVDEAHHVAAKTWDRIKKGFYEKRVLQFTATPFRNDGKKVDGKIIYNFPLSLAQDQGYFQSINFREVIEFDNDESDIEIAKAAVGQFDEDFLNGYNHTILVRTSTKERAKYLFDTIYNKIFKKYNPVLIISGISKRDKDIAMNKINKNESKILVCVDMFGEGIDIPSLKIAAIHDKYQSLPITLQFIGRFARSKKGLGNATIVANVVSEDINESLKDLYSQDSDWNKLLVRMSSTAIGKEISMQELSNGFNNFGIKDIDISKLIPKVSMIAYYVDCEDWNWENWVSAFDSDKCRCCVNEDEKVLIIIEMEESNIDWARDKEVNNINYQLHMLYWNPKKKLVYLNSTNKAKCNKLAESVLHNPVRVSGEIIFRCLDGINQLMLGTVGLKSAIDGPIRYRMFAGIDIGEGVTEWRCMEFHLFLLLYKNKLRTIC